MTVNSLETAARFASTPQATPPRGGQNRKKDAPLTLLITHGLHAGAMRQLDGPLHTIGSDPTADIVLADRNIAAVHARVRLQKGQVDIEAIGGDIRLAGGRTIPQGHGSRCGLPLQMTIGDAGVRLEGPRRRWRVLSFIARPGLIMAGAVVVAVMMSGAVTGLSLAEPDQSPRAMPAVNVAARITPAASQPESPPRRALDLTQAEALLAQHLKQEGLSTLKLENSAGRLMVSGAIASQQSKAWAEAQSWFDQTIGSKIPLVSSVSIASSQEAPRLVLRAIWYGDRSYIITADGSRYHEGAFTTDGWTIEQIGQTQLLLRKDGATVALKYP